MARQCLRHRMPDGTIMNGPPHGPDHQCIEWSNGGMSGGYKRGGKPRRKNKGGLMRRPKLAKRGF